MSRTLTSRNQPSTRAGGAGLMMLAAGMACGLTLLGGCGNSGPTRAQEPDKPVNTGLANIDQAPALGLPDQEELITPNRDEASIRAQIEESARQLSVYFTNLELDGPPEITRTTTPPVATSRPESTLDPSAGQRVNEQVTRRTQPNPEVGSEDDGGIRVSLMDLASGAKPAEQQQPDVSDPRQAADSLPDPGAAAQVNPQPAIQAASTDSSQPVDPRVRRDALAKELAGILSELVESGEDPGASALALASLKTLLPDDTGTLVHQGVLSEPERASIDAVRSLLGSMTSEGEIASPDQVSVRLETIKAELDAWAGLSIRHAALCTRVDGYGRYETFPSYRFIAGQAQEVIVYTELDRFAQSITMGPDGQPRYGIELSQRLELYHVADDLNTWNRAAETLRDESRNRLRDYYLTNRVWLPGNLGVGRYHLKIVMRDLIGEKLAETIIPIEIVAR